MGYLIIQILFFLLVAALLGFVIGWLWRGSRIQTELRDLDARWRSKLGEVESERDRFVGEANQANEARARFEASAMEAQRLAETHEASLEQLRREHQTKLGLLADVEQRVGGLESDLVNRDRELADTKASLAEQQSAGSDADRLGRELAAATARSESLESDLKQAKEANSSCRQEVERLEARIAELQRSGTAGSGSSGGGALGLVGSAGSSTGTSGGGAAGGSEGGAAASSGSGGPSGSAGSDSIGTGFESSRGSGETAGSSDAAGDAAGSSGGPLGLVGSHDPAGGSESSGGASGAGGRDQPGYRQAAASPSGLAEAGGQRFADTGSAPSSASADDESEGVRPEGLSEARGGVADDLKKISGVGPKLERTLNGLGIFHFSQIAAFTPDNVTWVDGHLRFKGRIERENWIEQARILAAGGETEFSSRNT